MKLDFQIRERRGYLMERREEAKRLRAELEGLRGSIVMLAGNHLDVRHVEGEQLAAMALRFGAVQTQYKGVLEDIENTERELGTAV